VEPSTECKWNGKILLVPEEVVPEQLTRGCSRTAINGCQTTLVLVFCRPDNLNVLPSRITMTPLDGSGHPSNWMTRTANYIQHTLL